MPCVVVPKARDGRTSLLGSVAGAVVAAAAAEVLVFGLAVAGFAVAPCRRLSLGVLSRDLSPFAFLALCALLLRAFALRVSSRRVRRAGGRAVRLRLLCVGGRFPGRVPIGSGGLLVAGGRSQGVEEQGRRVGRSDGVVEVGDPD